MLFQLFILCILNYLELSSTLTIIISWSLDIVFTLLFYSDAYIIRIFLGSMYSVICLISDYITVFIPQTFCDVDSLSILFGGKLRVPFTMLYVALIAVLVFLSSNVFDKKIQLSTVQKIAYFLVSVGGITIGHYMMLVTLEAEEKIYNSIFVFKLTMINLGFLLLFIFLLLNIYQLGYSKAMNTELLEQQKQYELEEQNYKILLHTTESLREIKHDINIHLDMIQSLLASENLDELKTYVESYHHALSQTHYLLTTGNTAIDCILSIKIREAKRLNIKTDYAILTPSNFPLDALSLSSLLGNMWNNALEACQRLQDAQPNILPYIRFYIKPFHQMIIIHMENNYDKIIKRNDSYLSIKRGNFQGIGLKRIANIVANADGILQINSQNNVFTVHILIPQEDKNETNNFDS